MPRMTRAKAAQISEDLHIDGDAVLEGSGSDTGGVDVKNSTSTQTHPTRKPLGEIIPNSNGNRSEEEQSVEENEQQQQPEKKRSARSKKGKTKATQGSTGPLETGTVSTPERSQDEFDNVERASEDEKGTLNPVLSTPQGEVENIENTQSRTQEATSMTPSSAPDRSTRSRAGKQVESEPETTVEMESQDDTDGYFQQASGEAAPLSIDEKVHSPYAENASSLGSTAGTVLEDPTSPLPSAMPNVIKNLRRDVPGKRSSSNKENVEPVESSADQSGVSAPNDTAPQTPVSSSAYDAPEAAVVDSGTRSQSSRRASAEPTENAIDAMDALEDAVDKINSELPDVNVAVQKMKTRKKEAPVVRMTKGAQARISLAQGAVKRTPSWGPPRQSTLGRSQSLRQASVNPPEKRVTSFGSNKTVGSPVQDKKVAVIPHSKPRPMSISFPAPKPTVKSTKPPTKSTFQLPGEAVAAKLKAAREERAQKELDTRKTFKARPAPPPPKVAPAVRETNASKFRQSLMNSKNAPPAGHRRAHSVAPPKPSTALKTERATGSADRLAPGTLKVAKRPSTAMADFGKSRNSLGSSLSGPLGTSGQRVPSKGTSKGREVFNRAAAAKASVEKQKREKEEATKKARAAAAERSRLASREWAEKQKSKKLGINTGSVNGGSEAKITPTVVGTTAVDGVGATA